MNDIEWKNYLATLPPDLADALCHAMERVNTLLNRERERAHSEQQRVERRLDLKQTKIADLRTIVADLVARVTALEHDDANSGPTAP